MLLWFLHMVGRWKGKGGGWWGGGGVEEGGVGRAGAVKV